MKKFKEFITEAVESFSSKTNTGKLIFFKTAGGAIYLDGQDDFIKELEDNKVFPFGPDLKKLAPFRRLTMALTGKTKQFMKVVGTNDKKNEVHFVIGNTSKPIYFIKFKTDKFQNVKRFLQGK
jgi:hypothetical protein